MVSDGPQGSGAGWGLANMMEPTDLPRLETAPASRGMVELMGAKRSCRYLWALPLGVLPTLCCLDPLPQLGGGTGLKMPWGWDWYMGWTGPTMGAGFEAGM